jgi:hypothetical protein
MSLLFLQLLYLLNLRDASGQNWTQIQLPANVSRFSPIGQYFVNDKIGFIFQGTIPTIISSIHLNRTTDGGSTWTYIPFFDSIQCHIQQIYFVSISRGYIAGSDGIYESIDSGKNWRKISTANSYFNSVYALEGKVFGIIYEDAYSSNPSYGPLISTTNDGMTWEELIPSSSQQRSAILPYVFGNKENLIFAETYDDVNGNLKLVHSTDEGRTWSSYIIDSTNYYAQKYTIGLFCFPHCHDILRTYSLHYDLADAYIISYSADFGASFQTKDSNVEIGAWIAGNGCAQYVCNANGSIASGIYRSIDRGNSWQLVNGPSFDELDDVDSHNVSCVGSEKLYIVTSGYNSTTGRNVPIELWYTSNGGDGKLTPTKASISFDHSVQQGGTVCDTSHLRIIFQNLSCNYTLLKNFGITEMDSTQYASVWKHHLACDGLADTIIINIYPGYTSGKMFTFKSNFMDDEFQTIDTNFSFVLSPISNQFISIYLKSIQSYGKSGDTVEIKTNINTIQSSAQTGATTITLTYFLNTALLTPVIFTPITGVTADPVKTTKTSVSVTLHFDSNFTISGETELGRLRCVAYVTDTLETDVSLSGTSHSSGCITALDDTNIIHFTLTGCGAQTLSDFMKFGKAFDVLSIVPNPAANSIQVELKNNGSLLHYELFDALGTQQKSGTTTNSQMQMDLSGLSSGNYYFRLSGDIGIPVTRALIIRR